MLDIEVYTIVMKKLLIIPIFLLFFASHKTILAHSGRTDSSGGHNCSAKSIAKGLCTGYHYHNGGSVSAPAYVPVITARPATQKPSTPKPTPEPTQAPTSTPTSTPEVLGISATTEPRLPSATPQVEVKGSTDSNPVGFLAMMGLFLFGGYRGLKWLARKTAPQDTI